MNQPPTDMREVAFRAQVEHEVRADLARELAEDVERAAERDRAFRALTTSAVLGGIVLIPLAAAVLGGAVRIFGLVSGLY